MRAKSLILILCLSVAGLFAARETGLFPTLPTTAKIGKQDLGFFLLPTNQLLKPWGEQTMIKGRPVELAFDSRHHLLAVLNTRTVLLTDPTSGATLTEIPARSTSYTGLAFKPGDRELWASETRANGPADSLLIATLSEAGKLETTARMELPGHPLPTGIAFTPDGGTAYIAFNRSNTLAVIDTASRKVLREIPTGMAPYSVAFAPKFNRIFVSNRAGRHPQPTDVTGPTSGATVVTDAITGSTNTGTLTVIDAKTDAVRELPVGLAPSTIALTPDQSALAVANSHSDSVTILNAQTLASTTVKVPAYPESTLGSTPNGLAFSPDGKRLYVACGGNNAVAILSSANGKWKVEGAIPTAWFPSAVAVADNGALHILNIKGTGSTAQPSGNFNSRQYEGSLVRFPAPLPAQIAAGTREVIAANSPQLSPSGGVANLRTLGIEHVFFIIKENRTYDQVFGDLAQANGDPKLVMYPRDVTPNQHALAEKYVILDNFHTGGAISFDGHQWLMQAFVSDYVERAFAASPRGYAWNMADALTVSPAGMFWQAATKPLNVRIYGEFSEPARWDPAKSQAVDMDEKDELTWTQYWQAYRDGSWPTKVGSRSGVPALQKFMDVRFPHASTTIPDQLRADELIRELHEFERSGKLPNLSIVTLETDHTNGTRPGSPTPRAMVAENDLALGRIVEAISQSKFWSKSLILVVEDDAQAGVDHVDGHRTLALAVGPMIRRAAVDSNHYNHGSMVRTIQDIFQIPAKTRFAAAARPMHSVFTPTPDLSTYKALTPGVQLDEMNKPLKSLNGGRLWAARQSQAIDWSHPDDIPAETLSRILWWEAKGYDKPYPAMAGRHR